MNEPLGLVQGEMRSAGGLASASKDSDPRVRTNPPHIPPVLQLIPLDRIDMDSRLSAVYRQKKLHFPPEPPPGFLTPAGIRMAARLLPMHGIAHEGRVQCFAGIRLWLAALNTLPRESKIEMLVYQSFEEERLPSIVEMEEDILYVWHRQRANVRRAVERDYLSSKASSDLRSNFTGKDQELWKNILKISLKTLQNRLTSRRTEA